MIYKFALVFIAAQVCTTLALPPCVCTRNLRPVCGSDGKTYSNQCLLDCERTKNNQELSTAREGPCDEEPPVCRCTLEYRPVCGTDGTTYPNTCSLKCQKARSADLEMDHEGQCAEQVKVEQPACVCTREMKQVCGSDGKTYGNDCLLNCATASNSMLSIAHRGPCDEKVVALPPCTCTREMKEVCGSDGKTYGNDCLLNCATASNSMLSIAHSGPCEEDKDVKPVQCACARNLQPVCGADGVTYSNTCMMTCAGAQLARQGSCDGSY